ncbi:transporter substrate-binding domain-containing protein [Telmatospirillum sp.]|uniref:substrate-binding periplasmic protein n=1 Tax=Telmatospirillum sp. TaxID=2079197 RepID=UPI00284F9428|nr:transporter substrate-binding domain-containing protein [Telmatospirillum sp.]MDR3436084.1 transporter substrate-binding domain-containing protein [Telmatospirillum sp.]
MFRQPVVFIAVLFAWHLSAPVAPLAADSDGDACKELRYATNPFYPPVGWKVDGGRYDGAVIELLEAIIPPGITLRPIVLPWKRAMATARQGGIDLLAGIRKTPERESFLSFTDHRAFPNPIVVFVRRDNRFPFTSWSDLKPRRGGISVGDAFGGGFDDYWRHQLTVEQAGNLSENFQKLARRHIDYFVTGRLAGEAYLRTHQMTALIIALDPPISQQDIHIAISRQSRCISLLSTLSRRLAEFDNNGALEALLEKHLLRYVDQNNLPD